METFDVANMSASRSRRNSTTVAPQALTLLNGDLVNGEAPHFTQRVIRESGSDRGDQVGRAFRLTLGRPPSPAERDRAIEAFAGTPPEAALARLGIPGQIKGLLQLVARPAPGLEKDPHAGGRGILRVEEDALVGIGDVPPLRSLAIPAHPPSIPCGTARGPAAARSASCRAAGRESTPSAPQCSTARPSLARGPAAADSHVNRRAGSGGAARRSGPVPTGGASRLGSSARGDRWRAPGN